MTITIVFINLILYLILPLLFLISLWRNFYPNFWKWLLQTLLFGSYIISIFQIGAWPLTYGYYSRYVLLIAYIIATFKSFRNLSRNIDFKFPTKKEIFISLFQCFLLSLFSWQIIQSLTGSSHADKSIELEFPLKDGDYYVLHGGSNLLINHHNIVNAQKYALDIVKLNNFGIRAKKLSTNNVNDFYIYNTILYSPCDGIVIETVDYIKDNEPMTMDSKNPAGNYIAIAKTDYDVVIILAHLKEGSLKVKQGDRIYTGQPIGNVGNSGNTSEPHLHIHAVRNNSENYLFKGEGVPMTFKQRFLIRNDIYYDRSKNVNRPASDSPRI